MLNHLQRTIALAGVLLIFATSCATYSTPPRETEITKYVKSLASRYPASKMIVDGEIRYEVVLDDPPVGDQAIYRLSERTTTNATLTVLVFDAADGVQRLTLFVDNDADGNLDYVVNTTAATMRDALQAVEAGRGHISRHVIVGQPVYTRFVRELRDEVVLAATRW